MNQSVQTKYYSDTQDSREISEDNYSEESGYEDFDSSYDPNASSMGPEGGDYGDLSAKDLLTELSRQAQAGRLTPEQEKKLMEELHSLERQLQQIGTVDNAFEARSMESVQEKLGQIENDLLEGQSNFDKVNTFSEELAAVKKELTENKYLSAETRKELEKRVAEIEKQMGEDFSFNPDDVKEGVQEIKDQLEVTKDFEAEAKRTEGLGAGMAAMADSLFSTQHGITGSDLNAHGWGIAADLGGAGYLGWIATAAIVTGGLSNPIGWAVGGTAILGGLILGGSPFSTDAPHSNLNNLPEHGRDLDLIMKGKSGLPNTQAPGQIVTALYDTSLSPEDQQKKIQEALMSLPPASQAYVLSTVTNLIAAKDPQKLTFLKEKAPTLTQYMSQAISTGQGSIKAGEAAGQGDSNGYSVKFDGMNYEVCNEDTHWYSSDWDNRKINLDLVTAPMGNALSALGGMGGAGSTPSTSYSNVPTTPAPTPA